MPSTPRRANFGVSRRIGFTVTELLVVIGVMVLVMSIVTPMAARAWRAGDRTRTAADLQAIAMALEAYRQDHGTYPVPAIGSPPPTGWPNPQTGAQLLCSALVSPATEMLDGADGPGFRVSKGNQSGASATGRVYGPYLPADRFKMADVVTNSTQEAFWTLQDHYGRPILYYPARGKPNIRVADGFVKDRSYRTRPAPMYNSRDNLALMPDRTLKIMLGDTNANGMIDGTEEPRTQAAYILWCAGPDETFGPPPGSDLSTPEKVVYAVNKSDDVTNFSNP